MPQPPTPHHPAPPDSSAIEQTHRTLSGAVRAVSGVTLLSRFAGMARDVLIVRMFGETPVGSAFVFAFKLPNTFRRLFGEGALSAAFIPEYTQAARTDPGQAVRFASLTVAALAALTFCIAVLIEAGLLLALILAPPDADRALSFQLAMVMTLFMPFICVAAILAGMLQVHGRFGPASTGPLLLNFFMIASGLYFVAMGRQAGAGAAFVMSGAVVASGLTQCFWFLSLLRRHIRWTRDFSGAGPRTRTMLRRFVPVLLGMGTLQINTLLDSVITMWPIWFGPTLLGRIYPLDKGSAVILSSAERLYQFPLGVFGLAVATAIFPLLARHADEPAHFSQTLRRGLRLSLFIGVPASIGLILIRHDIMAVLFSGGSSGLSSSGLARAAAALGAFAPGVWAYSLNHVLTRAFYAKGDTWTPMKVSLAMVACNFVLNCVLIWFLKEAGLAAATSISAVIQCLVLGRLCRRYADRPMLGADFWRAAAKIAAATAVMTAAVLAASWALPAPGSWSAHLISLIVLCLVGGAAYPAAAHLLRCHELGWLLKRH